MNEEKYDFLKTILIIGIAILASYSLYRMAVYNEKRIESLENNMMKVEEEVFQIKLKLNK
ncbi:MAG: hypothetical protein WC410_03200 [Candidatus Paceibacterota bacterium]|jgi:hypothetical protein